jgi:FixJ family two-component response regulator
MSKSASVRIVYVVDGDASVREGMSRLMDAAGLEARPCASVPEFLDQARGMRVACVLLDVWGARQCEAAVRNALLAVAKVLPVIALSSSDDPTARHLARELGAQSFFRKPVDAAALLDSIEWVMQGDGRSTQN